jgi:hypothetical protein
MSGSQNEPRRGALRADLVLASSVTPAMANEMFRLFTDAYDGVDAKTFLGDLRQKTYVIRILDGDDRLRGFSTLAVWTHRLGAITASVLFSGDTVIDRQSWGHPALAIKWLETTGALHACDRTAPLYWLLTSKGHRTFRFLQLFYESFYPDWRSPNSALESMLAADIAATRFPDRYDSARGILVGRPATGQLVQPLAAVPPKDLRRPDVRFFLERNPGYVVGDELVCLARLDEKNHRPTPRRFFRRGAGLVLPR